jgi:hypothetical protein
VKTWRPFLEQCTARGTATEPALAPPLTVPVDQRRMPRRYPTLPRSGNGVAFPKAIKGVGRPRRLGLAMPARYARSMILIFNLVILLTRLRRQRKHDALA